MGKLSDLLFQNDLKKVANLQVLARSVVEGFCAGLHRSPHKGFSIEFKQHRQYVAGDDLRYLDWKVYGKSDRFFIREYEEETNLRAMLLLDCSGSMTYAGDGAHGMTKLDYAIRLSASLAYLMLQQQDSVGLVSFDTKIRKFIPSRSRPRHLQVLVDELSACQSRGETAISDVFREIIPKIQRRGLVIVLSDCFDDVPKLLKALTHFRFVGHELIVFQILDRDELTFPFNSWTRFDCLERKGTHHIVDPSHLRNLYLQRLAEYTEELTKGCRRLRIDLVPMCTDQPYADALARYLGKRRRSI